MCGRYASSRDPADLVVEFEIDAGNVKESVQELPDNYNVAPTDEVIAVVERKNRENPEETVRKLTTVKWGLVPSWAKDTSIGSRLINARMETVAEKPAFKKAFAVRRCILPADGYYEWYTAEEKVNGKPVKQPYFIRPADGGVLAMAGLYEIWRNKAVADADRDDAWLWTCTVLTTTATDDLGRIHDRMPLLVEPDRYNAWLNPLSSDPDELLDLLVPAAPGVLEAYAVSKAVSSVKNNGPHLIDPLPPDGVDPIDKPEEPEEITLFLTFPEYLYIRAAEQIAGFDVADIYAISLWCSYYEDDTRLPTLVVDYNTETQVEQVVSQQEYAPEPDEARWNYAYWLHSVPVEIGGSQDPTGLELGHEWIKQAGLWYSDEQEESDFEATLELGSSIARRFEAECIRAGRRLHEDGVIEKVFGRPIPVLVHELEHQPHHADWAIAGNPPELVAEYVAWIHSLGS